MICTFVWYYADPDTSYCVQIQRKREQAFLRCNSEHKVDSFLLYNSRYLLGCIQFFPVLLNYLRLILVVDMRMLEFNKFIV